MAKDEMLMRESEVCCCVRDSRLGWRGLEAADKTPGKETMSERIEDTKSEIYYIFSETEDRYRLFSATSQFPSQHRHRRINTKSEDPEIVM